MQAPPLLDHWLVAKLRRYALPSAFDFAVRAAHLSAVFDAGKMLHPLVNAFVSSLKSAQALLIIGIPTT
ncbi:MAG: hypothetical protein ABN480_02730 [Dickeya sp.]